MSEKIFTGSTIIQNLVNSNSISDNAISKLNGLNTAYSNLLKRRESRLAMNEFHNSGSKLNPSNIMDDIRDSLNINGPLQTIQQTKFELKKSMINPYTQFQSDAYFESYNDYIARQNEFHNLTLNSTEMAQHLHTLHATSSSNYIQQQMRSMTNRPYKGGRY